MSFSVKTISKFETNLKKLAKKYPSLKAEYAQLVQNLKVNPEQGTPLGKNCFKIRLSVASKGRGKSGGASVVTNIFIADKTVYLLTIYDKSEKENLTDKELKELLRSVPE
ncbi:MAG: type II toxin-antitoxin system RelE/ParE family toxin [Flavobacteriaceae bacterium]|nr:type II toxin-antitoxin system RelE/ParE family toxin [Flavobacteriaceae bacterium]MDZ4147607.1 type II toxin-antitoxin system RelE/ParE family toxin [Flavobacteriaceae bacterium]